MRRDDRPSARRLDRQLLERELVAVDLETTGYEAESERIIEIGAVRIRLGPDGAIELGERFLTFADPERPLTPAIRRLTGISDEHLAGAPSGENAVVAFAGFAFRDGPPVLVGHNIGFDIAFLERAGMPLGAERLDTADLASILLPSAASYALQRLAADAAITPDAAHRALDDAITSALVLGYLARIARGLPAVILSEIAAFAELLGPATAEFFKDAASVALVGAWADDASRGTSRARGSLRADERVSNSDDARATPAAPQGTPRASSALSVGVAFAPDGPLARSLGGYEDRPEQREL